MALQTEFEFTLPRGYLDKDGNLHRHGVMRLATARDEIAPLRDHRVQANEAYFVVILLSRVVTKLGDLPAVNPGVIEGLFAGDLQYLQAFYEQINARQAPVVPARCPQCEHRFEVPLGEARVGEFDATPLTN